MWKVKEDSFTKEGMVLRRGRQGEVSGGLEAATVKSGSARELGSSSTANPHLRAEVMKTKRRRRL